TDRDGTGDQRKGRIVIVVRGTTEISLLGNDCMTAQRNGFGVIDDRLVRYGSLVVTGQIPRRPDAPPAVNMAILSELGPETAEQKCSPAVTRARRRTKKQ